MRGLLGGSNRRVRSIFASVLLVAGAGWLALDNGPALRDEWRLRHESERMSGTVVSKSGYRPQRAIRRFWDDLIWGQGRGVSYEFVTRDGGRLAHSAFVSHSTADVLREGSTVQVRYLAGDPKVSRIAGEAGLLLLLFRLALALALLLLAIASARWTRVRPGSKR